MTMEDENRTIVGAVSLWAILGGLLHPAGAIIGGIIGAIVGMWIVAIERAARGRRKGNGRIGNG